MEASVQYHPEKKTGISGDGEHRSTCDTFFFQYIEIVDAIFSTYRNAWYGAWYEPCVVDASFAASSHSFFAAANGVLLISLVLSISI